MNIITLQGGLGNQMFQYAFSCAMRRKAPWRIWLYDYRYCSAHQGFELTRIFTVNRFVFSLTNRLIRSRLRAWMSPCFTEIEDELPYEQWMDYPQNWTRYTGYWQTEKYFKNIEPLIRKAFRFREDLLNLLTRQMASQCANGGAYVSLHIRRGDYLTINNGAAVLPLTYYRKAIEMMNTKLSNPTYMFFSDDMQWVKDNIHVSNAIYVDWNTGKDSWQDMYLMAQCNHNIIANSSFSWWGAWLNNHSDKIIIAPTPKTKGDFIPDQWIQI